MEEVRDGFYFQKMMISIELSGNITGNLSTFDIADVRDYFANH